MQWFATRITGRELYEHRASVVSLVLANAVPLLGVLFLGWSTYEVVLLYWFENVVIGVMNVLRMACCTPDPAQLDLAKLLKSDDPIDTHLAVSHATPLVGKPWLMQLAKLFFIPFFVLHYGLFCIVHGVFVVVLLGDGGSVFQGGEPRFDLEDLSRNLWIAAAALTASHLVSFFVNYLGRGEYRRTILPALMMQPYGRVFVLHVAIILGAFALAALGSPALLLAVLILLKTLMDLGLHLAEHQGDSPTPADAGAATTVEQA